MGLARPFHRLGQHVERHCGRPGAQGLLYCKRASQCILSVVVKHAAWQAGRPFLGICLGLQLLFEGSEENGGVEGLGLVPGRVTMFDAAAGLPVPHIGWNDLLQKCALT